MLNFPRFGCAAFALMLLAIPSPDLHGQDYLVDASVTASGDGKTWGKAFKTLQEALKVATMGKEIWVTRGSYFGGFAVPPGVAVRGNFVSGDTRTSQRMPGESQTILDGANKQRVLTAGTGALLESLQIIQGKSGAPGGGGLLCVGTSPTVRDCIFRGNHTTGRGTALYLVNNSKGVKADPLIENCYFLGNGILGPGAIHNIDICNSKGRFHNIGVHLNSDNGLHYHSGSTVEILNSYFVGNTGRGICHIDTFSKGRIENCLFYKNSVSLVHYQGKELRTIAAVNALTGAKNNLDADPLFLPSTNHIPLYYPPTSPLVDSGQNLAGSAITDLAGNLRQQDGKLNGTIRVDVGPLELAASRIELTGRAVPGGKMILELVTAQPKLPTVMIFGAGPLPKPILIQPWGHLQMDITQFFLVVAWNQTGAKTPMMIPLTFPKGGSIAFQNLALTVKSGNFSNLYDLRIR